MLHQSFLVIDNYKELCDEDMKVKTNPEGRITEINKKLRIEDSYGEYIGIAYLKGSDRIKFFKSIEKNLENKNFNIYYEDALNKVLKEINLYASSTHGKPWTEVDTIEDYKIASKLASGFNKAGRLVWSI